MPHYLGMASSVSRPAATLVRSGSTTLTVHLTVDGAATLCGRKLYADDYPVSPADMWPGRKVCKRCQH